MRWRTGRRSESIEDRRRAGVPVALTGGGLAVVVAVLLALFFGVDPRVVLGPGRPLVDETTDPPASSPAEDPVRDFVSAVLADTADTWEALFRAMNREYQRPKPVLFSNAIQSACGVAGAAVGPFYCPADGNLYLDLSFFRALHNRFRAPGEFAQAYVIAHGVGHHVQTLLGISDKVAAARDRGSPADANELSVRQELQADCFAGIWAHHARATRQILEEGDLEEALGAAAAIGDDRLQQQRQGPVVLDSFTHGTSAQRVRWFKRGFIAGDVRECDTFAAAAL